VGWGKAGGGGKGGGDGGEAVSTQIPWVLMAYLTAVFRVRSRQPRLLLVNFEGSAMPWPGPGSQSPGAVTLGQRGDIFSPGAVGYDHGPDLPASSRRPNRCDPGIFEKRWHHSRRFLTREPSHIRLFLDTLPGTIAHHHSLLPSSRCLVSLARLTAPFPHSGVFSLTSDERCCRAPPIACRQLDHKSSVLSLPFGRRVRGFNSD
jgi:hypothetical protein